MAENLSQLERDVEATRARLSGNLATLRAPATYSEFADGLKQTALDTKDSIVEQARSRTRSTIDELVDTVKAKAAANPAAVLVIGAGLAWHLIRKPPVVTALVGGGLLSLLKTPATPAGRSDADYMTQAQTNLRNQATDMARAAGDAGRQAADYTMVKAADVGQQAMAKASAVGHQAMEKAAELGQEAAHVIKSRTADLADKARDVIGTVRDVAAGGAVGDASGMEPNEAYFNEDVGLPPQAYRRDSAGSMDRLLLGAAGLAIAATLVATLRSRGNEAELKGQDGDEPSDDVEVYRSPENMSQAPQAGMM